MLSLEHKNDYFYLTCNRGKSQGGMKIYADFTGGEKAENVERKRPYSSAFSAIQRGEKPESSGRKSQEVERCIMNRTAALHNLGCKVNAYETEVMQQMLTDAGYTIVPFNEMADVYIINTCSVTNMADKKSRQMISRARKTNPEAVVAAAGCYVQAAGDQLLEELSLDLVIGNNKKKDLVAILDEFFVSKGHQSYIVDLMHTKEYEEMKMERSAEHTRAYIKVQDGCNQFCSYCIIPFTRGRVRSRRPEDVREEIEGLCNAGYQEFVLTGIHLSSYGVDFSEDKKPHLLDLIRLIDSIDGVKRIRLGSLEPGIITEEFARALHELDSFCPHFHLSLQSGCNTTLRRMNRRYTAEEYAEKCEILRKVFNAPALTTDVIVGFPGETVKDFEECHAFLEKICFYETHIFKYSRRQGTKAADMPDQIPESIKGDRSHVLLKLHEQNKTAYIRQFIGQPLEVLFEEKIEVDGESMWSGYSREYIRVLWKTTENLENKLYKVTALTTDTKEEALIVAEGETL